MKPSSCGWKVTVYVSVDRVRMDFVGARLPSIGNIGMARRNAIATRVKDERLTIVVLVLLDLTYKNKVITPRAREDLTDQRR